LGKNQNWWKEWNTLNMNNTIRNSLRRYSSVLNIVERSVKIVFSGLKVSVQSNFLAAPLNKFWWRPCIHSSRTRFTAAHK
jgi:hypothetical protein